MSGESPDVSWWDALAAGRFLIQRSRSSGRAVFPPRVAVPGTGERDLEWIEASGRGTVHSFTLVSQKPPRPDYNICLVDLAEGPRLVTRLADVAGEDISIGMAVEAVVEWEDKEGGEPVLLFRPVSAR